MVERVPQRLIKLEANLKEGLLETSMSRELVVKPAAIALIMIGSTVPGVIAQTPKGVPECVPVGELATLSRQRTASRPICANDRPQLSPGQSYQFLCYSAAKVFSLVGAKGVALPGCTPPITRPAPCVSNTQANCIRKGPAEAVGEPVITLPYGRVLMESRPTFAWRSIPGTATYIVKVSGPGVSWAQTTQSTRLAYPAAAAALQAGNVYTVIVIAQGGAGEPSRVETKALALLPQSAIEQVTHAEQQIQSWLLEPDTTARLLDGLYIGRGLLDRSIQILEQRVQAGSQDPQLHQHLGDRYLEAGWLDEAKALYNQAQKLGQQRGNLNIVAQAQAGLEKIAALKATHQPR